MMLGSYSTTKQIVWCDFGIPYYRTHILTLHTSTYKCNLDPSNIIYLHNIYIYMYIYIYIYIRSYIIYQRSHTYIYIYICISHIRFMIAGPLSYNIYIYVCIIISYLIHLMSCSVFPISYIPCKHYFASSYPPHLEMGTWG